WEYRKKNTIAVASFDGGNKHNAIPREAFAVVVVPNEDKQKLEDFVASFNTMVKAENATKEPNLVVSAEAHSLPESIIENKVVVQLLNTLYALPHGVIKMSADIEGLVETSTNLAVVTTREDSFLIVTSQRSSVASENADIVSEILGIFKKAYSDLFGKEPEVKAIHAGLECGIIGERYPELDMISCGPTMFGVHSPDERLNIPSVEPFFNLLKTVLARITA
ncbi:MAG: M20/M25/M40 family metallo-hydrolase, partial [Ignavibacteriales bacterium]|nr:M20/M25/M40 family metallo-hydrolase [Ignavibacteriales bacterium]